MSNLTINTGIGAMQYVLANLGTKQLVTSMLLSTKKDAGPLSPAAHVVHWDRRLRAGIGWVGTHWVPWPGSRLKGGIGAHGMLPGYHYPLTWGLYRYGAFRVQVCAWVSRSVCTCNACESVVVLYECRLGVNHCQIFTTLTMIRKVLLSCYMHKLITPIPHWQASSIYRNS